MNLFISNLSFKMTDDSLRELFEEFGAVASATVIMDKQTQRSKGFGFVEMLNDNEAQAAISNLHGQQVQGRNLVVNEARPRN